MGIAKVVWGVGCTIGDLVSLLLIPCSYLSYPIPSHLLGFLPRASVLPRLLLMVHLVRFVISSVPNVHSRTLT